MLHLGVDVGSTTVKVVAIQPDTKEIVFSKYQRHNACQSEIVLSFLKMVFECFPHETFRLAFCGSGGRTIASLIHAPYIQEVVANSIAVRNFYPHARVAIELGGQDAKIVFFHHDETTKRLIAGDMRMNGSCAGGTGAFIDEIATLLRTPVEEFEALAARGTQVYEISGRCGVFAKTDIQPLLNQGGLREDVALSTFHAIVRQTIGGLAQGLEIKPPVIFEGGPLTFNPTLIRVFAERLGMKESDIIRPQHPELLIAWGTALAVDEMFADFEANFSPEAALTSLSMFREIAAGKETQPQETYFTTRTEQLNFEERHRPRTIENNIEVLRAQYGDTLRVYLGIDAGSTTSKFALIDERENVVDSFYAPNKGEPLAVIRAALIELNAKYRAAGITLEVVALGTTGYGELLFDKALGADYHTVETVAHAAAAQKYVPGATFILDIGGQDMKAINITNDIVTNITVNEACSSGCGSFLENFAATLGIPVTKIAGAAFGSKNPARLGSRCTVFMNSTIITEQKNGKQADDLMAGLCRSIIENVFTKVVRISNQTDLGDKIVVQGGTFKNDAVLRALEQYLGRSVVRAPFPGEMGAIGIALLTKREILEHGYTSPHGTKNKSRFIGFDALENFSYTQEANLACPFCSNKCNRTLIRFSNGQTWITGNRCERGELVGEAADPAVQAKVQELTRAMDAVPDMVKIREELLFKDYVFTSLLPQRNITIGLPRVMDFWRSMPFWKTFYRALGFNVKLSRKSSQSLFDKGIQYVASDTVCFPAKLIHGHVGDLAEQQVDRIFLPQMNRLPPQHGEKFSTFTCAVLKGYPLVIRHSDNPEQRMGIPFDSPVFHWFSTHDRDNQLCQYMRETFNTPEQVCRAAIKQADAALAEFNAQMLSCGKTILADVEKRGEFAVVIAGRYYQYDELVNHHLSRYFTSIGIPVLTLDSLPGLYDVALRNTRCEITNTNHAQLLSGAIIAAEHKALEYAEIYSFGCGHDALYSDEIVRIMNEISGKTPLILKLDESDVAGPLRIRVRSFVETVMLRRQKEPRQIRTLAEPYPVKFKKTDCTQRILLIPNVSRAFCHILSSCLVHEGVRAEPLPMGDKEAIALGKKYVHNDICFPAQVIIGEALLALQSGKYDLSKVAVGTGKILSDCRLTNYMVLTRKALDAAGFSEVPVFDTDLYDTKNIHPGFKWTPFAYAKVLFGFILTDVLEKLRRKIRPYELEKGETDRIVENAFIEIGNGFVQGGIGKAFKMYKKALADLGAVRYDRSHPRDRVLINGEYFMPYHQGANLEIERYLEDNGMEVIIPDMHNVYQQLFVHHTVAEIQDFGVRHSLFDAIYSFVGNKFVDIAINFADRAARKHPLFEPTVRLSELAETAVPLMHRSIMSGESFLIGADIAHYAERGVRSFVLLQPFGCLPNHFCGRGIVKKLKEWYPNIQILPLDYDPDVSFANIENRLQMLIMNARQFKMAS
ncbi:MAG: acyl-CoA dehydratase activase [Spirochaetaceae bacterium]|jgi:predicted CoA-substrate-specific enzyme activase|nr:acyl-CoA dehydratase activase [Spirochaetaceae bacterium]